MAGKPRKDRTTIAGHHLGLRLNDAEHETLMAVVTEMNRRMRTDGYPGTVSATALVRMLIQQKAIELGILKDEKPFQKTRLERAGK